MVIRAGDRVASVLDRDERLLEVFIAASPVFERLKNPGMRRTMARLVTVEQAARIARLDPADLLDRLNDSAGARAGLEAPEPTAEERMKVTEAGMPLHLSELPLDRLLDLDVREDLRLGREPFSRIMAAKASLPAGGVLRLRATFEPVPLYHVLGKQGFDHWTERLADDDWRVWFFRSASTPDAAAPDGCVGGGESEDDDVVVLDVRGLEPPEPMVRTLAALEALPAGKTLLQINVRTPQFLLPRLDELGFSHEIREQEGVTRVFIRRRG